MMGNSETTISTSTDPGEEVQPPEPVVVAGGTSALDATTVDNASKLSALEERLGQLTPRIDNVESNQNQLQESVAGLSQTVQTSFEAMTASIGELTGKLSQGVQSTVQAVTEPVKEIVDDSAPTIKEHGFFRSWKGNK